MRLQIYNVVGTFFATYKSIRLYDYYFINLNNLFKAGVLRTSENAYKKYLASRPAASADANARVKKIKFFALRALEDFLTATPALQQSALANHSSSKSKKHFRLKFFTKFNNSREICNFRHWLHQQLALLMSLLFIIHNQIYA